MDYSYEPKQPIDPIVKVYHGLNIYECSYENHFYATEFPDGTTTGAPSIEEVEDAIETYYS